MSTITDTIRLIGTFNNNNNYNFQQGGVYMVYIYKGLTWKKNKLEQQRAFYVTTIAQQHALIAVNCSEEISRNCMSIPAPNNYVCTL